MRRSREETKEADRNEKMRIVQMQNLLEQNAQEEQYMMIQAKDELKRNWAEEVARKRILKEATPFLFDEQKCGPASAQVFGGFDEDKREAKARIQQVSSCDKPTPLLTCFTHPRNITSILIHLLHTSSHHTLATHDTCVSYSLITQSYHTLSVYPLIAPFHHTLSTHPHNTRSQYPLPTLLTY